MKKVLSILLAVCLTVAAIPFTVATAVGAEAVKLSENFDSVATVDIITFNGQSAKLEAALKTAPKKWHAVETNDNIWYAPAIKEQALNINTCTKVYKRLGGADFAKAGDTYIIKFKAKNTSSSSRGLYVTVAPTDARFEVRNDSRPDAVYETVNIAKSNDFVEYTKTVTLTNTNASNKDYVFSVYHYNSVKKNSDEQDFDLLVDDITVKKIEQEPANSGLIMDGDFEATEQIATFNVNSVADNTWYKKETKGNGVVTLSTDADHGNYVKIGDRGEIVQKVSNIKADEGAVITFKAKVDNGNNATNDGFTLYLCPKSWHNWYFGNIRFSPTAEWAEYTVIYNPQAGDSNSFNGKGLATGNMTPVQAGIDKINAGTGGSHTWDPEEEIILRILNNSKTASKPDVELYIDDIHIEKLDPFASNDLGQAELTGVSMRGANGSLPTAIRWKNAIAKTFAENGIGDFKVIEYGALVANTSTLESNNEKLTETATSPKVTGLAYNSTTSTSKLFDVTNDHNIFSLALYGITAENYGKALSVRPYAKVSNDKYTLTIYGESRSNSLFDACHAVLSGTNETDIALVKGILTETDDVKQAYLKVHPGDSEKLQ